MSEKQPQNKLDGVLGYLPGDRIGVAINIHGRIDLVNANEEYLVIPEDSGMFICDASTEMRSFHQFLLNDYRHLEFKCIHPIPSSFHSPEKKACWLSEFFKRGVK